MQRDPKCNPKRNKYFANDKEKTKIPNKWIGKYVALRTIRHDHNEKNQGTFWTYILKTN